MGSGPKGSRKLGKENQRVTRIHHPLSVPTLEPPPHLARGLGLSVPRLTERKAERAGGPRNRFRGAEQYFRESVAEYCSGSGRGAVPPGPCCCGQLGGGWLRPCRRLRGRGPRRPPGVCACAVRSGSRSPPPSRPGRRTFFLLRAATQLNIP